MPDRVDPEDEQHLDRAMHLALNGRGAVSPNPVVGAVVVREGQVLGEGWHAEYGGPHAERVAIEDAEARGHDVAGATVYVSLEPCAHEGKQPPCAELLREKRVSRVVVGCDDPSGKTAGRGPALLGEAGVEVVFAAGERAARARDLVQDFRKATATGRPLVTLKMASSLDGRVAGPGGAQIHLTSPESDREVHRMRAASDAVAVGSGTVAGDDPRLTARDVEGHFQQPRRIVFGRPSAIAPDAALLAELSEAPVWLVAGPDPAQAEVSGAEALGVEVLVVEEGDPAARFVRALDLLGERGIRSLLLEGGPALATSALEAGEVDRVELFFAPLVLGEGPTMLGPSRPVEFPEISVSRSGRDVRISSVLREW